MGKHVTAPEAATAAVALAALLLSVLSPPASAATFKCSGKPTSVCTSLLGFPVANFTFTNYTTIASLFNTPLPSLLAANNITTAAASRPVSRPIVTVPIPCTCSDGTGTSGNTTQYRVLKGDFLDLISRTLFGGLVTFEEVAKASAVVDVSLVEIGQKLTIPIPCSCDQVVPGELVVHYAYKVADGDSIDGIAKQTGATVDTIRAVNNITDPKVEQILDVPLRTCGPSPSPLLVGSNFTTRAPCPAVPASPPGSESPSPTPAESPATRAVPGFAWTRLLVLSRVVLVILSFPRMG